MTSKVDTQTISIAGKQSKMKTLAGLTISRQCKFMGDDVTIRKLMVFEVLDLQSKAKEIDKGDDEGLAMLRTIIRLGCMDCADVTDEDFLKFPLDELSSLSNEIMSFSGVGSTSGK